MNLKILAGYIALGFVTLAAFRFVGTTGIVLGILCIGICGVRHIVLLKQRR